MSQNLDWPDFIRFGWQRTPYGQLEFARATVELTLLEPDYAGRAELMVQAISTRKMSQRSIRFELPTQQANTTKSLNW